MKSIIWTGVILLSSVGTASAALPSMFGHRTELDRLNRRLAGQVLDFTHNHGADHRIWSEALGQKRDLYVYLPPHFNPQTRYPLLIWLHGVAQDETAFTGMIAERIDAAIREGRLPPMIVAAPDGSLHSMIGIVAGGSFFANTPRGGAYENFLMNDVWNFLFSTFPLLPEREAHAIAGLSMGGGASFTKAIKFRDRFKIVAGIYPPVNVRWSDCHGNPRADFDPDCIGWKTDFNNPREVIARFYGVLTLRQRAVVFPLYGRGNPDTLSLISQANPIEMLDAYDVKEGEFSMYIAYAARDQFNIDAQVESFLYRAKQKGLTITVDYDPRGRHDIATAQKLLPGLIDWLGDQIRANVGR